MWCGLKTDIVQEVRDNAPEPDDVVHYILPNPTSPGVVECGRRIDNLGFNSDWFALMELRSRGGLVCADCIPDDQDAIAFYNRFADN